MTEPTNTQKQGWRKGVCWALARLVDYCDQPTYAIDLLRESGITYAEIQQVDEADRLPILRAIIWWEGPRAEPGLRLHQED